MIAAGNHAHGIAALLPENNRHPAKNGASAVIVS
jgi:hypothetical protein